MGVFGYIKEKKRAFHEQKRIKTTQKLAEVTAQLKIAKAEGEIRGESVKLSKQLRQSRRDLFEAKHPVISGALKSATKKIKENQKKKKGIFAESNTPNPFLPTGTSPFNQPTKKGKKGKGPGEGIFY